MKYKRPKYSNYKKLNKSMSRSSGSNKRWWIIGGIAAVVIAAIIATVVIVIASNQSNIDKEAQFNASVKEIQIAHYPDKLVYYCGMELDTTGLAVYSLTNGGEFTKLNLDECTITGFDSSVPVEKQTVTVTYKGFSDVFSVQIKEAESVVPMLVSITMGTLPKTEYKFGEAPDIEGGTIICTYSDGSTKTVKLKNDYISGFGAAYEAGAGEHDITVTYTKNGIQAETTYKITITK